jgi:hypothetical protein
MYACDLQIAWHQFLEACSQRGHYSTLCMELCLEANVRRIILAVIASLVMPAVIHASVEAGSEWPPLRLGVWERSSTKTLPSGKTKTWTHRRAICHDTRTMFWGYWGTREVGIGGCAFDSRKISQDTYRIVTKCDVRGGGEGEAILTMKSADAFELTVTTKEGGKVIRGQEAGRRVGECRAEKGTDVHR